MCRDVAVAASRHCVIMGWGTPCFGRVGGFLTITPIFFLWGIYFWGACGIYT